MKTKFIFVIGGVLSGLGKGVSAASIGRLLKFRGYKIFLQKFDPYLNIDPGTMSPYQHGEVFVTKDGGETDLDLGHYERFTDETTTKFSNYTAGKIINDILIDERKGKFLGKTVQVIPHVTSHIEELFKKSLESEHYDFVITEIGGTVGDIESQPFIYALTNFVFKNPGDVCVVHTTYVPFLKASKEHKSKPTQNSIKTLRSYGINPNIILLRSNRKLANEIVNKVALASRINKKDVFSIPNNKNIYAIPLFFESKNLASRILMYLGVEDSKPVIREWESFVQKMKLDRDKKINIALIGKYTSFTDAYMSIIESIRITAAYQGVEVNMNWISSEKITDTEIEDLIKNNDGAIILPGFGIRGFEGKVRTIKQLRNKKIPTLGICYGMQAMVIDQANRVGIKNPVSYEHSKNGSFVIDIINKKNKNMGGTLRLGEYTSILKKDSFIYSIYKSKEINERHRHRFEVNPRYKNIIEQGDFIFSGISKQNGLVEICELKNHPFFIGVQYHPEFNSTPLNPSPLFNKFIEVVKKSSK